MRLVSAIILIPLLIMGCIPASESSTGNDVTNAPKIAAQPVAKSVIVGDSVLFLIDAVGENLVYQWKKNGSNIGKSSKSFAFVPVLGDSGAIISCVVSNSAGTITSIGVVLTVTSVVDTTTVVPGMKVIQGGTFSMGSSTSGIDDEQPVHSVTISAFMIGKHEITQKEYASIMDTNPSYFKGDSLPVEQVSWFDAVLYCNARSKKEGKDTVYTYSSKTGSNPCTDLSGIATNFGKNGYRLPTESEWEYACRAGTSGEFYWGNDSADTIVDLYAVYSYNSLDKGVPSKEYGTHIVGTKPANNFGLYDMSGNVWEWCGDIFKNYDNPYGGGFDRVRRGGGWDDISSWLRSAFRFKSAPKNYNRDLGFRVCLPLHD